MLSNITLFEGSKYVVIFLHGLNYYGCMFHYEATQQLRSILTDHNISHALYYKHPTNNKDHTANTNEQYLLSFIQTIQSHNIIQPIILIGHSSRW